MFVSQWTDAHCVVMESKLMAFVMGLNQNFQKMQNIGEKVVWDRLRTLQLNRTPLSTTVLANVQSLRNKTDDLQTAEHF